MNVVQKSLALALLAAALAACRPESAANQATALPTEVQVIESFKTAVITSPPPTPLVSGQEADYNNLHLKLIDYDFTLEYTTDYNTVRKPGAGQQFLWIHVGLRSSSQSNQSTPDPEHFSVLFQSGEVKPSYGHRKDHPDYPASGSFLLPGQELDAWLRFVIPDNSGPAGMLFAFLPESTQVSFISPSATSASWASHPVFLWSLSQ